ncbi:baseplate multidomain protein megatron [Roseobacter litoralis]|uniref:baseplate multidomain protein megatron n=1 Tax=Roseobacter litoralis TaxID=42443 RepID=UPI0024943BFF|nr:glycoside hydrolase TIM-barrel-like domain-containing protein [Roseobacter litoralis]
MATLLLGAAGAAIGSSIGGTLLGVGAATIGQAVGATIGRSIDQKLLGGLSPVKQEGPRLDNLDVMTSQEGAALSDISGRTAVAGEVIWATKMKEVSRTKTQKVGSGKNKQKVSSTEYSYFASFAVSLGEGPLSHYGRVWANGELIDLTTMINRGRLRFYNGSETQLPDPLIDAIEGGAPAYRGTAYMVVEDLPLARWGNTVPQIKVEVWGRSGDMEALIKGVNVIPAATEWGYMPTVVERRDTDSRGRVTFRAPDNAARHRGISDWKLSIDSLEATLPEAETVSLVVSWFGTDLRAGQCRIEPRIERRNKNTTSTWRSGGLNVSNANLVSTLPTGRPSFGSTPADISIVRAIKDLKARGKRVVLYPFIMMDITDDQALPHPSGVGVQGAYPWRGRIVPTAGQSVTAEVAAFMGTSDASDFSVSGERVNYNGPASFGFRRFVLHLASLAKAAGGVDAFLVGTEMRGLSMTPDAPGDYPFVTALKSLTAEVRAILPSAQLSYAADWSEYHSHQDGADLRFHLDPLWSDPNIDFIGIDNYLPLSDWRPGSDHADYDPSKGHTSPYVLDYLKANIEGGEYWDYFYASDADRTAQNRTPISDGAYGEPWVFRQKAIREWQANAHHERISGVRKTDPTSWSAGSKPVWFTEIGCPAVDNGANRPNVFSAANTSEGSLPWFSAGVRDDFMQRQFLVAVHEWWAENGGPAVDVANFQVWCWDSRPFPEFPKMVGTWSDGPDWFLGHWLNGRAGAAPAGEAIRRRLKERHGLSDSDIDVSRAFGQADGYPAPAPIGFRDFLQPLEIGLGLQAHESGGKIIVESRGAAITAPETPVSVMVDVQSGSPFTAMRGALEDVSATAIVRFIDGIGDYESTSTRAMIGAGLEQGVSTATLPLVLDFDKGTVATERLLRSASDGRESISFSLPRSATHVRPGIILPVVIDGAPARPMMVERVVEGEDMAIEARSFSAGGFAPTGGVFKPSAGAAVRASTAVIARFMDLPHLPGAGFELWDSAVAFHADPWPVSVLYSKSPDGSGGFSLTGEAVVAATMGETQSDLAPAQPWVWTEGALVVTLYSGSLVTRSDVDVFSGANVFAIEHPAGWEVVQFGQADLIGTNTYRLSRLLRGVRGTEFAMGGSALPSGARLVLIDDAVLPLGLSEIDVGRQVFHRYGPSTTDEGEHSVAPHIGTNAGQRPLAPAHLTAVTEFGEMVISWKRRTRETFNTFNNNSTEPPLGESFERYNVTLSDGASFSRVIETTTPSLTYTAAERLADGDPGPLSVSVAQISENYGPGPATTTNERT